MKKETKTAKKRHAATGLKALIFISLLTFAIVAGVYFYTSHRSENTDITYTLSGMITTKLTSCGEEHLVNGHPEHESGICDSGEHLIVNGVSVFTGGGALSIYPKYPAYMSDIGGIHVGDRVEIRYVHDENGGNSTNCKSCYVKVIGDAQPRPQKELHDPRLQAPPQR